MKKKRIVLHLCILLLATISISCLARAFYLEENLPQYMEVAKEDYANIYISNVVDIIDYADAQIQYREDYSDNARVLIKNEEFGNITVADLPRLYNLNKEYNNDVDIPYEWTIDGKMDETRLQLEDEELAENLSVGSKEKLEREYKYYQKLRGVLSKYANCVDTLIDEGEWVLDEEKGLDLDSINLEDIRDGRAGWQEFCYSLSYQIGDKEYVLSNVDNAKDFGKEIYESVSYFNKGSLVMENDAYNVRVGLLDSFLEGKQRITKKVKNMSFAVNVDNDIYKKYQEYKETYGDDAASQAYFFLSCREDIVNAPSRAEIRQIKKAIIIYLCIFILTILLSIIPYVMLLLRAGHKIKGDIPQAKAIDRGWIDAALPIIVGIYTFLTAIVFDKIYDEGRFEDIALVCAFIMGLSAVELCVLFSESFARRIKTKILVETTLLGNIWKWIKKGLKKLNEVLLILLENTKATAKVVVVFIIAFIWNVIQLAMIENFEASNFFFGTLLTIMIPILILCALLWIYLSEKQIVVKGTKRISEGEIDYKIEEPMKFSSNRVLTRQINEIGEGLNKAVEESVKNERMKTELITNVSHDLKTPLTSIINYVDLLKTDGLNSEKAEKYLDVLDQKSQRLKNLTEDLVEASKLNSGVAKIEMGKLDLVQLVNQSLAEYDERFKKRKLQIIKTVQEEPIYVMADGRKTWRLLDNLYNNVAKYAMSGTRVYVDISTTDSEVFVSVKNISEGALNFSAEELMERFVRGDVSRNTEGSGLGLSIAKSIAERQNGKLEITLDGDLFKVTLKMELCK